MTANDLKLYHSATSPNSRRVRIFLAEKAVTVPLVPVNLGKGEQDSKAYRAINPRRLVPTLGLVDGSAIGDAHP
jgi:glutathione S-transferase